MSHKGSMQRKRGSHRWPLRLPLENSRKARMTSHQSDGIPGFQDAPLSTTLADDVRTLHRLGYHQELLRRMSGFSNFAVSLSIICILAGCITSFPQGFCSVGGAAIGLGWPLGWLFALCVALTMAQ